MVSLQSLADSVKFETVGMALGVTAGGLTEMVATEVVDALQLDKRNQSHPSTLVAEMLVRGAIGAIGFVLSERLLRSVNRNRSDPTDGSYFTFAFAAAQDNLYQVTKKMGHYIAGLGGSSAPCCDGCAHGGSCDGN